MLKQNNGVSVVLKKVVSEVERKKPLNRETLHRHDSASRNEARIRAFGGFS